MENQISNKNITILQL